MPGGRNPNRLEIQNLPSIPQLDASKLFLPSPEQIGVGCLTYLPAMNLSVLAWWGNNPWDDRPKVNSAIIVEGYHSDANALWDHFSKHFPELAERLKQPVVKT